MDRDDCRITRRLSEDNPKSARRMTGEKAWGRGQKNPLLYRRGNGWILQVYLLACWINSVINFSSAAFSSTATAMTSDE